MSAPSASSLPAPGRSPTAVDARGWRLTRWIDRLGRSGLRRARSGRGILAFVLVTFGSGTRQHAAHPVLRSRIIAELYRSGWQLLPMTGFVAVGLGWVLIGQTIALLDRLGAQTYMGPVILTALVREIGPLIVAFLVLTRSGTLQVVELGTVRALGEVEALEALGIDPIHYLVLPRVMGILLATCALTVYFNAVALAAGWLFAFLNNIPVSLSTYVASLLEPLTGADFAWMALKSAAYGTLIGGVTCYQGLSRPLQLQDVGRATTTALVHSIAGCIVIDLVFLVVHLAR